MRLRLLILTLIILFFEAGSVFAISPPVQISPINNSQVSSSKLTWETPSYSLYSKNPYRIQVDNDADFSSVFRDYDTKNTYYKPELTEGSWYWRIKAKDSNGNWSDWSDAWSFVLIAATPSPIPSSTPTPTPAPTPTPTPVPTTSSSSKTKATTPKTPAPTINLPPPSVQEIVVVSLPVKASPKIEYRIASVAAAVASATPAASVEVKNQKQTNPFALIGIFLIFAGVTILGYIYLRRNANHRIKLRKRY